MRSITSWVLMFVVALAIAACSEPQDRIQSVGWMGDGEFAIVKFVRAGDDNVRSYKIRCKDNRVQTPFDYVWEDDCDLNTELNGFVQDWDNPEDDRFEDRSRQGSNERYYDDDDDDDGIDLGDVAIGALIGSSMSKKPKTKVIVVANENANKRNTNTNRVTTVTKPKPKPRKTTTRSRSRRR